jgi:hypothetical protein
MPNATPPVGYEVKFQRVGVGGGADLQIRSLLDKQQFFDPLGLALAAGISSATWPLFGLLWPSAQKLADLMQTWDLAGKRILEVGCGLGLASLVVHRREGNIIASDCHPLTELFLKANVLLNGLPPLHYETGNWGRVNIQEHAAEGAEVLIVDPNRGNRTAFHKDMANMGFGVTELLMNEPLQDLSAYRGRLLHYKRG